MQVKSRVLMATLWLLAISACVPAGPYDQDLYSSAQEKRLLAEQAIREAEAAERALTATSQAPIIRMTETAAAVVVMQTQAAATSLAGQQTQQAALTQTAMYWTPTPNLTATLDTIAINAAQTQTFLDLERAATINDFKARAPGYAFAIVALVLAIFLMNFLRRSRYQPMKYDPRGKIVPVLNVVDGTFVDVNASPNFTGSMNRDWLVRLAAYWFEKRTGVKLLPMLEVTAQRQDAVKFREQMIDLATRGLPAPSSARDDARRAKAAELMTQPRLLPAGPVVQVVGPDQEVVRPILRDVLPQIAQDSIDAELVEPKEGDA